MWARHTGEVRECEGALPVCVTGHTGMRWRVSGGDGADFVWDAMSMSWSVRWRVCVRARACARVCVSVRLSAPWGWVTPGITCPWVSSHAKPDCSNMQADQVQPVLPTLEGK